MATAVVTRSRPVNGRRPAAPTGHLLRQTSPAGPMIKRSSSCSPTTHPGSFRCSLHKRGVSGAGSELHRGTVSAQMNTRRSAMVNSLARMGTVEGDQWMRQALRAAFIRPYSSSRLQQRRRLPFRPRPSRLSLMSNSGEG